jgi:hypothetical protein
MAIRYLDEPKKAENIGDFLKQNAPFVTGSIPSMARGAVNKVRETTSQPILRFLANAGLPSARKESEGLDSFNQTHKPGTAEKVGGVLADAAMMMAPTPLGKTSVPANAAKMQKFLAGLTRGGAAGAQGAAQHQAQNYGATGEVSPGEAAGEIALTTGTMGVGNAIPAGVKNTAAGYLQLLTRAPKRLERGMNPPTTAGFRQALENKIFPIFKGGFKEAERRGIAKQVSRDAEKTGILDAAKVQGNAPAAIKEAEASILGRSGGRGGLLPTQKSEGISQLDEYRGAYRDPHYQADQFGYMPAEKFLDLRKMADQNANWVQGKTPAGLDLASQEFRTAAENQLSRKMAGKAGEKGYTKIKDEMAELAPVLEAFNEKAISNYSLGPEMISALLGASVGQPYLALAPAARRLPQVAPAMYEVGRAAGSNTAKRGAKVALDLGRASYYGMQE